MKRPVVWIAIAVSIALGMTAFVAMGFSTMTDKSSEKTPSQDRAMADSEPAPSSIETQVPPADGFDFPVGPPDAKKYYNAQPFQKNHHLGEDWNGNGGGNTDFGDPVFAIGIGVVVEAEDYGAGWGNVLRMYHNIGSVAKPQLIESLYAHLDTMLVHLGDTVKRGQQIGNIGDAHGAYWAHLHLEMRHDIHMELGAGYDEDTTGYLIPTKFIQQHRRINNE